MFETIVKQLRSDRFIVWFNSLTVLLFLALSFYVKLFDKGGGLVLLFDDPFSAKRPYIGTFSAVSDLLWCVCVTICLCSFGLLKTIRPGQKINSFILYSAIGTGVLLMNDAFRMHLMARELGIPKPIVYLVYGSAAIAYGLAHWRVIRATPYFLLLFASILFIISAFVDTSDLPGKGSLAMLEDGTKLLGIINITLYFRHVCWKAVLHALSEWRYQTS
jgi:hypothetical protein